MRLVGVTENATCLSVRAECCQIAVQQRNGALGMKSKSTKWLPGTGDLIFSAYRLCRCHFRWCRRNGESHKSAPSVRPVLYLQVLIAPHIDIPLILLGDGYDETDLRPDTNPPPQDAGDANVELCLAFISDRALPGSH